MSEPLRSAQAFSDALRDVTAAYLRHFEPSANPELYRIRMEATGPELNITYDRENGQTPFISFTMHADTEAGHAESQREPSKRGLFS
jgi:hypothetical protein